MITRFSRYELKYILPVSACERIIADIRHHLRPDSHGGAAGYRICSLYYDSPGLDAFWSKIEGLKYRRKVRLRIYPGADITKVERGMVEIKERVNRIVAKRRLELPLDQGHELCTGGPVPEGLGELDRAVASEVHYLARGQSLRPTAITSYLRRAFAGEGDASGLRITFDTDLRSRITALTVNAEAENRLIAPLDWCIMEVKVNDSVPDWVVSMLARHNCPLRRISKYCAGVALLKGIPVMPLAMASAGGAAEPDAHGRAAEGTRADR